MALTTMEWAREEVGRAALGDVRRTRRAIEMAAGAAANPSGKVSTVFDDAKDREGAYDFLENQHVSATALAESIFVATAERARGEPFVYVAIDGSSLTLTDRGEKKKFGPIGTQTQTANGLIVNSALAVAPNGTPLGLIDQEFWSRPPTLKLTKTEVGQRNANRTFEEKETSYTVAAAKHSISRLEAVGVQPWIVIDSIADNRDILLELSELPCTYSVRGTYDRTLSDHKLLRSELAAAPLLGTYEIEIARNSARSARRATLEVRSQVVELLLRDRKDKPTRRLKLTAVWIHEPGDRKEPVDWILYTNLPVSSFEDGLKIVEAYRTRWRIEEFHRTWKQGHCNVEEAQLRSVDAMIKWATILAAVAVRIERLKYLSRARPSDPASVVLSRTEIEVLEHEHHRTAPKARRKRTRIEDVTVGEAAEWIASLGGWTGRANGPPGAVTIGRGLERLTERVRGVEIARSLAQT